MEKRKSKFGIFMLVVAVISLVISLIFEYLSLYDVAMVARYDYSKVSNTSNLMTWAGMFFIVISLTFFVAGLKNILPQNKKMYWGIIIFSMSAVFFMLASTIAVLAFFNIRLGHGQDIILNSLVYTTIFLVLSVGLLLGGIYVIFFLNRKEELKKK